MSGPIAVFYKDCMNAPMENGKSPGIWKARELMKLVVCEPECAVRTDFAQATTSDFNLVHDRNYVNDVMRLKKPNGHGNKRQDVLDAVLWQNGSFMAAAKHAVANNTVAFSPTSGFHHAGFDYGGGFCTFNALMAAADSYLSTHPNKSVLIIDGDAHLGDGCLDLIFKFGIRGVGGIKYITTSRYRTPHLFMDRIRSSLYSHDGLVMYQAGGDCHADDTYMSGNYTAQEMRHRDRLVFQMCKDRGLPVVWNLAGGYGAPTMLDTIRLHYGTWRIATEVFCD